MASAKPSPFFEPGPISSADSLALLHLARDHLIPTILCDTDEGHEYAEGRVTNTRFGSFPHSTLIYLPWGSQVLASKVDTGSRGRKTGEKRKRGDETPSQDGANGKIKTAVTASSGFAHLVPPTPESWTVSLPHRTQVVYTPDYSYILQRLAVRPGSVVIEAGAGSGSFTHAAARAVFNGGPNPNKRQKLGKVYSFEFHEERATKLRKEIEEHGLGDVVRITHRDVYQDGFALEGENQDTQPQADAVFLDLPAPWLALKHLSRAAIPQEIIRSVETCTGPSSCSSPEKFDLDSDNSKELQSRILIKLNECKYGTNQCTEDLFSDIETAEYILLLLNANTTRRDLRTRLTQKLRIPEDFAEELIDWLHTEIAPALAGEQRPAKHTVHEKPFRSPLKPTTTVHICTFSPCMEQVEKTIKAMRTYGYLEIDMIALAHRRVDVRRDRVGLAEEGLRGANAVPKNVEEAVERLKEVETRWKLHQELQAQAAEDDVEMDEENDNKEAKESKVKLKKQTTLNKKMTELEKEVLTMSKAQRLEAARLAAGTRKLWKEGRVTHRTEPELKTHTSYLVFAILPVAWSEEDEEACMKKWNTAADKEEPTNSETRGQRKGKSKRAK